MKKFLRTRVALMALLGSGSAMAADMGRAPVYKAPPPVYVHNWTGFYVGANLGYSWGRASNDWNFFAPNAFTGSTNCTTSTAFFAFCATGSDSNKLNGAIGGFQAGYNWQSGNFVAGVETDIQLSGQKGDQVFTTGFLVAANPPGTVTAAYTEKLQWLGTARGRLGFTPAQRVLVYATGGLAYGRVTVNGSATGTGCNNVGVACNFASGVPAGSWSNGTTKAGWTIGAGAEAAITNNWSLKIEYLHVDLGNFNATSGIPSQCIAGICGGFGTALADIPTVAGTATIKTRITDEIIRVGVNYKFGGPVIARY